ncbi:MAG: helix-turn-helix domain-containing protein [Oscillospiraceae bacterium]
MYKEDFLQTDLLYFYHNTSNEPTDGYVSHCHAMYEIFFFMQGNIDYKVEGCEYTLSPESILLIAPGIFHGVKINTTQVYHRFSVHFMPELLTEQERETLLACFYGEKIYYPALSRFEMEHYFRSILECAAMPAKLQAVALKSRITALLTQISYMYESGVAQPSFRNRNIQEMVLYLNENIKTNVSLDMLAEKFYLSKNHLNVVFRRATGTTVNQYLRVKRLALAQKSMLEGAPASQAAAEAGFGDYSNFYRAYKAFFGGAPSKPEMEPGRGG